MTTQAGAVSPEIQSPAHARDVTEQEAEFYRENGWVYLPQFIPEHEASTLLSLIQSVVASNTSGDGLPMDELWETFPNVSHYSKEVRAFTRAPDVGRVAADLQGRPVRFWTDGLYKKMPGGLNQETPWHQDQPYVPFDRVGRPQIWLALNETPPERGSLRFLSGSQRAGNIGRAFHDKSGEVNRTIATLRDAYAESPPLTLRAGDATVHDGMTVHASYSNTTDEIRWTYIMQLFVADALNTGSPNYMSDPLHLAVNEPFPDEHFPIVGWPSRTGHPGDAGSLATERH